MRDPAGTTLTIVSSHSMTEKERNSENSKSQQDLHPRPGNAAAWAWYQRAGGATTGGNTTTVRSPSPHVAAVRRASRFREEAMKTSFSGIDSVHKADSETVGGLIGSSLFDSYELVSVAKQLEEALSVNSTANDLNAPTHKSYSKSSHRRGRSGPMLLCSSIEIVAMKDKTEHLDHHVKICTEDRYRTISSPLGRLSKAFHLFSLGTTADSRSEEYQR
ncbi:hypothetical protein O6H91_Y264500 [Diphasiastrum complanatum]|nr:hypothetical protein O6H91_Y264500 [Diphasiastrum complanatum]